MCRGGKWHLHVQPEGGHRSISAALKAASPSPVTIICTSTTKYSHILAVWQHQSWDCSMGEQAEQLAAAFLLAGHGCCRMHIWHMLKRSIAFHTMGMWLVTADEVRAASDWHPSILAPWPIPRSWDAPRQGQQEHVVEGRNFVVKCIWHMGCISTSSGLKNKRMTDCYPSLTGNITKGRQNNGNDEHNTQSLFWKLIH